MEQNQNSSPLPDNATSNNKGRFLVFLVCILIIVTGFAVWFFFFDGQNILNQEKQQNFTTETKPEFSFKLKDISQDPRFSDEKSIEIVNTYDLDPCLNPYGENLNTCTSDTFEKEVSPGIKAVIELRVDDKGNKTSFLKFFDSKGQITKIPEIQVHTPGIHFLNENSVLLIIDPMCGGECPVIYRLFNGDKWINPEEFLLSEMPEYIDTEMLFGYGAAWEITVTNQYIRLDENNWFARNYGGPIGFINQTRPYFSLFFDNKDLKFVDMVYNSYAIEKYADESDEAFKKRKIERDMFLDLIKWITETSENKKLKEFSFEAKNGQWGQVSLMVPTGWEINYRDAPTEKNNFEENQALITYRNISKPDTSIFISKETYSCSINNAGYNPFTVNYRSFVGVCPSTIEDLETLKISYLISKDLFNKSYNILKTKLKKPTINWTDKNLDTRTSLYFSYPNDWFERIDPDFLSLVISPIKGGALESKVTAVGEIGFFGSSSLNNAINIMTFDNNPSSFPPKTDSHFYGYGSKVAIDKTLLGSYKNLGKPMAVSEEIDGGIVYFFNIKGKLVSIFFGSDIIKNKPGFDREFLDRIELE